MYIYFVTIHCDRIYKWFKQNYKHKSGKRKVRRKGESNGNNVKLNYNQIVPYKIY